MKKWKFTGRLQSFVEKPELFWDEKKVEFSVLDCIDRMATAKGVTHIEPNYPMHFKERSAQELKAYIESKGLATSGVATRFEDEFIGGELTNPDPKIRAKALNLIHETVETCKEMGGTTTTIWSAFDGFDYPFQADYGKSWRMIVESIADVAKAHPDMKISIEYKPYEPRQFYFINDIGTTLLAIEDAKCDNLGVTLDFAHMIMKKENPAYSLALAAERGRLFGFHLNDGYGSHDDGLMLASVNLLQTLEFVYYMRKYNYDDVIFFDTFPKREDPVKEFETNIALFNGLSNLIDNIGEGKINEIIASKDAIAIQRILVSENLLNTSLGARSI
ncbi:TIM barrel protein [Neobacillus niacini]|uniref:sugar phosphate isomerase/epimerase family protein n=1 Tax=Neobacillus niacini TaxID=86668 RepID=UPI0030003DE9